MIARKLNDKNADMDHHAVPPPDNKAGGDSKREELCQQDPKQVTMTATLASSSSGRPEAIRDPMSCGEGKVYPRTNTDGERHMRNIDDPEKSFELQN